MPAPARTKAVPPFTIAVRIMIALSRWPYPFSQPIAPPYPPQVATTYSARCAGPEGITVLDGFECWLYQHGLRHMGEIELARGLVGLGGMTS